MDESRKELSVKAKQRRLLEVLMSAGLACALYDAPAGHGQTNAADSVPLLERHAEAENLAERADGEAQKSDNAGLTDHSFLTEANLEPRARPLLDASVESLLERMAQARSSSSSGTGNNPSASGTRAAVSDGTTSVESLLARMAAVRAPSPAAEEGTGLRLAGESPAGATLDEEQATFASIDSGSVGLLALDAASWSADDSFRTPPATSVPLPEPAEMLVAKVDQPIGHTPLGLPTGQVAAAPVAPLETKTPVMKDTPLEPASASRPREPGKSIPANSAPATPLPPPTSPARVIRQQSELVAAKASAPSPSFTARLLSQVASASEWASRLVSSGPGPDKAPEATAPSRKAPGPVKTAKTISAPKPQTSPQTNKPAGVQLPEKPSKPKVSPTPEPPPGALAGAGASSERTPPASLKPPPVEKLRLQGIAAFGKRRAASINGRCVFQGDETEFNLDGVRFKVRCVEIREASALVQIAGLDAMIELQIRGPGI